MAIQFYLTDVGRTAALNADNLGLDLQIKYIAVGSGQYNAATAAPTKTALTTELERYLVNGGEIEPITHTLRFTVNLNSSITADIYEIGLFDENNVLFAVAASTSAPLVQLINEVITIITFGFSLDDVDNITLMLDVNSPLAVTLMNQHTAHEHPHAQYKRINDDTERLKIANGTDPKDAVNKEQLDAEATARANADTNLQNSKAAKNGDNTQRFKVSSAVDADDAVAKNQLDTVANVLPTKANKNGDAAETFNVANGTSGSHAVNKSQLDAVESSIPTLPTLPILATETVLGLVEKATQAEMNSGAANVWPDAATIVGAFALGIYTNQISQKLPNGFVLKMGLVIYGELPAGVVSTNVTFNTPFDNLCLYAMATPYNPEPTDQIAFLTVLHNWTDSALVVKMYELVGSVHQVQAGYVWLAVGY